MPYIPANYQTQRVQPRIAHIGLGAFHRAHMAWACHELLQNMPPANVGWGITALSLRGNTKVLAALEQQGYRYLLATQGRDESKVYEVGSIVCCVDAVRDGVSAVVDELARAAIISVTATEKGYYINAASRKLDEQHPDIRHDLEQLGTPKTILGFLALGLAQRQKNAGGPLALISCDNIPGNSQVLQSALQRFVKLLEQRQPSGLSTWIEQNCRFPCTMVDRITPAATAATLAEIADIAGKPDPIALATEEFTQWVIEDDFPAGRPAWEHSSGVSIVGSEIEVGLYEEMKLRMLNGSHSFLAYCGFLAGKEYIFECMQDATLRRACYQFITQEPLPTLELRHSLDLHAYADQLIERYSNPHILHRCYQIAMDGSLKIPQRWLEGYRRAQQESCGTAWHFMPFALAAWLQYLSGRDLNRTSIQVQDPNAEALRQLIENAAPGSEAEALFSFKPTFGNLFRDRALIAKVQDYYQKIVSQGLLQALRALLLLRK